MQYIRCNSALLAQETLFLTQKGTVFQIYKSFGIWEDPPPPCWEKFPNNIVSFFMRAYLTLTLWDRRQSRKYSFEPIPAQPPCPEETEDK